MIDANDPEACPNCGGPKRVYIVYMGSGMWDDCPCDFDGGGHDECVARLPYEANLPLTTSPQHPPREEETT